MITYDSDISLTQDLIEETYNKAFKNFQAGESVFIKISQTCWMESNVNQDTLLPKIPNAKYFLGFHQDPQKVIVTRHPGVAEWFKKYKGIEAPVLPTARPSDVLGKVVYTSGINIGLLGRSKGAYVLRIPPQIDCQIDTLTADQINEMRPTLSFTVGEIVPIPLDEDIKNPRTYSFTYTEPEIHSENNPKTENE